MGRITIFLITLQEGFAHTFSEKKVKIKPYWLVLLGPDLYYYENESKEKFVKMKSLYGCFVKGRLSMMFKGQKYYCFEILFKDKTRKYLVKSKEESLEWAKKIRTALGYKNLFESYEVLDDLGKGSYGLVKIGLDIKKKEKVAIKIINKGKLSPKELDCVSTEIEILKFCKHPNIVNFIDHFENSEYIFIILEYIKHGDLSKFLNKLQKNKTIVSEAIAASITYQIANGLHYLHQYGVIHRDLKLENIMVKSYDSNKIEVKILDFGLSKIIGPK